MTAREKVFVHWGKKKIIHQFYKRQMDEPEVSSASLEHIYIGHAKGPAPFPSEVQNAQKESGL